MGTISAAAEARIREMLNLDPDTSLTMTHLNGLELVQTTVLTAAAEHLNATETLLSEAQEIISQANNNQVTYDANFTTLTAEIAALNGTNATLQETLTAAETFNLSLQQDKALLVERLADPSNEKPALTFSQKYKANNGQSYKFIDGSESFTYQGKKVLKVEAIKNPLLMEKLIELQSGTITVVA